MISQIIQVTDRSKARLPSFLKLHSIASFHVVGEIVNVFLCHSELELHNELIVAVILKMVIRGYDIFDLSLIECPDDCRSIKRITRQAMITEEEYWKAQELLGNKGKPRPKSHKFAFTGLMKCGECGCGITAEERVNRYGSHYTYYHCTKKKPDFKCSQEYIQEKDLEVQMLDYLDRIQVSKEFLDFALNYLEKEQAVSQEIESANEKSLEKALNDCERKLGNLNEMRLRELIDDEEYLKEKRKLTDEKAHLEVSIKKIKGGTGGAIASATRVFTFAYEAKERFLKSSLELKKSVIRELGSNFCLRDKNLSIDVEKPFKLIQEGYHVPIPKNARLEPQNNPVITRFLNPPQPQFLIWGALVNDVRTFFVDKLKNGEPPT